MDSFQILQTCMVGFHDAAGEWVEVCCCLLVKRTKEAASEYPAVVILA